MISFKLKQRLNRHWNWARQRGACLRLTQWCAPSRLFFTFANSVLTQESAGVFVEARPPPVVMGIWKSPPDPQPLKQDSPSETAGWLKLGGNQEMIRA